MPEQKTKPDLYWMDKPYSPGCIYRYLETLQYEVVVSLDIGHGESVAYQCLKNESGKRLPVPLILSAGSNTSVMSYAAYLEKSGKIRTIIGNDAKECPNLLADFKKEPADWEDPHPLDSKRTYGEILRDYIKKLWEDILNRNETLRKTDPEQVLITIGCPASPAWISQESLDAYCSLAAEATGYPHVTIIPESTAAIMSAIYSDLGETAIDLEKGVAVYDFGSSTIDFTFIIMGKVIVTRSLRLGGSNIDRALLEMVLRTEEEEPEQQPNEDRKHTCYKTDALMNSNKDKLLAELRTVKEQFCRTGVSRMDEKMLLLKEHIQVYVTPEWIQGTGKSDPSEISSLLLKNLQKTKLKERTISDGKKKQLLQLLADEVVEIRNSSEPKYIRLPLHKSLYYTMDEVMLRKALTLIQWKELKGPYQNNSWCQAVNEFFRKTEKLINPYGCGTVILTGGTSNVPCVRRIAQRYYSPDSIHNEPDSSVSVARGMSHAMDKQVSAATKLKDLKKKLQDVQKLQYQSFCRSVAGETLFPMLWDACAAAADSLCRDGKAHTKDELIAAVQKQTADNTEFLSNLQTDIQNQTLSFWEHCIDYERCPHKDPVKKQNCGNCDISKSCSECIRRAVNGLSAEIYKANVGKLPPLPDNILANAVKVINQDVVTAIIHKIKPQNLLLDIAVNNFWSTPKNAGILERTTDVGVRTFMKLSNRLKDTLSIEKCKNLKKAFDSQTQKEKERSTFSGKLAAALDASPDFYSAFNKLLDQQLEIALGIVLFQVFENADMK